MAYKEVQEGLGIGARQMSNILDLGLDLLSSRCVCIIGLVNCMRTI